MVKATTFFLAAEVLLTVEKLKRRVLMLTSPTSFSNEVLYAADDRSNEDVGGPSPTRALRTPGLHS